MQRAALTGEAVLGEVLDIVRADGEVLSLYEYAVPLFNEGGELRGCLGASVDISDRQRAAAALRASESRFKALTKHATVGIFQTDGAGDLVFVNERWAELAGLSDEEACASGWLSCVHPDDRSRIASEWTAAVETSRDFASVFRFRTRENRVIWLSARAVPLRNEDGDVTGYIGTVTDISERKQAEDVDRSLLRISERLNSTLDTDALLDVLVQEAIALVDAESGVSGLRTPEGMVCTKYFKNGAPIPLEYCWPPLHGLPGWLIVHKVPYLTNDAASDPQIVHELCSQFGVWSALSTPIVTAQGEVIGFFEIHNKRDGSPFGESDRELLIAVSQAAAIAVQNALAYQKIQQAEASLKESDRRKDEFLATLAHELRNPLAPIRNAVEMLRRADDDADLRGQRAT